MDVVSLLCSTPTRPRLQSIVPPSRRTRIAIASIGGHSPRKAAVSRPRIVSLMQSSTSSTSSIPPGDALVLVPGDGVAAPSRWLAPFCAALDSERSVWLWFGGERRELKRRDEVEGLRFRVFFLNLDENQTKTKNRPHALGAPARHRPPCSFRGLLCRGPRGEAHGRFRTFGPQARSPRGRGGLEGFGRRTRRRRRRR